MIWVGIDDTDMPDTPGTNQLARKLAQAVAGRYRCRRIVRHQLCGDPSIPCTSKNGSASLLFEPTGEHDLDWLLDVLRTGMRSSFIEGSDPGLCLTEDVPDVVRNFGRRAQRDIVTQGEARFLAAQCGIHLEGLGGTEGGVIGALAAVGLAATGDDGRVVQLEGWGDDLSGVVKLADLALRGVAARQEGGGAVLEGTVDVGKKLRPNCRGGEIVLTVIPAETQGSDWTALKLT
jgi:hypothetical protein